MKIKKRYDRPDNVELNTGSDSYVQQALGPGTRVQSILERFTRTGELPVNPLTPRYEDVSDVGEYNDAMNLVARITEHFESLPSDIRLRFSNNPAEYLAFINDPNNIDMAVDMGLLQRNEPELAPAETAPAESAPAEPFESAVKPLEVAP